MKDIFDTGRKKCNSTLKQDFTFTTKSLSVFLQRKDEIIQIIRNRGKINPIEKRSRLEDKDM